MDSHCDNHSVLMNEMVRYFQMYSADKILRILSSKAMTIESCPFHFDDVMIKGSGSYHGPK